MRVNVLYMTQIRRSAGRATEAVESAGPLTLLELLRTLAERHGAGFRGLLLDETEEPRKSLLFFVGDEHADLQRSLRDGDAVTILAPMAGG